MIPPHDRKLRIKLTNTSLENVFKILSSLVDSTNIGISPDEVTFKDDYPDGITRRVTRCYLLMQPHWDEDKLIIPEMCYILTFPSEIWPEAEAAEIFHPVIIPELTHSFHGLVFTGWETQINTVLLELGYTEHWQELVDGILPELLDLFPEYPANFKQDTKQSEKPQDDRRRGEPGRRRLPDDLRAWEQVNTHKRPMNDVWSEWLRREGVMNRRLADPKRQFNRITKPEWGQKTK